MRPPATTALVQASERERCHHCCKILAIKTAGIVAAAKMMYDQYATPVHPSEGAVAPQQTPMNAAVYPAVHAPKPCGMLTWLGVTQCGERSVACPIADPIRWSLHQRELGTSAIAHTRQWLRTAADTSATPGVLATVGAASAIPTAALTLSAPAVWVAAVTMFTVGALDASYQARVQREVRQQMRQLAEAEAAKKAMWPTTMEGVWELAQESAASMAAASVLSFARKRPMWATSTASGASAPATAHSIRSGPALHLLDVQRYLTTLRVMA